MLGKGKPDFVVQRWGEYKSSVADLDSGEIKEIDRAADRIVASFARPLPVRALLVRGHADYDLRRSGEERELFELKISHKRAEHVRRRLLDAMEDRVQSAEDKLLLWLLYWREEGFGSKQRVKTTPQNDHERSLNRRVEIFVAESVLPIKHVIICPHGGIIEQSGLFPYPSPFDVWLVTVCRKPAPLTCTFVQWITSRPVVDPDAIGLCFPSGEPAIIL
jgi:hypothetical protein